ncbi:MAG: TAT-variant-translocated molybdopterin oxidoreductase [Verrucomicrobiota bacterium]
MKRKFDHSAPTQRELAGFPVQVLPSSTGGDTLPAQPTKTGPKYWRSLDELADTPGFREHLAREFPEGASELNGVDRRQFMRLMAASFALGGLGLAGCRRPEKHILPYGKSVEYTVPGLPLYFATAMPLRKTAIPLVAETHQGRPTKLEGNPSYKPHGGASSLLAQASVLDLYDPERATAHTAGNRTLNVADVHDLLAKVRSTYAGNGEGLAFLADESASPTRARLVARLKREFPRAIWAEYEPVQDEPPIAAAQAAFGRNVKPVYRFAKAKRIVSLDADFLHAEAGSLYYARSFADGRRVSSAAEADRMNRLYVAESGFSLTGSMADHRLRLASSHLPAFAAALAGKVLATSAFEKPAQGLDIKAGWIEQCAEDLLAHRGESLVVAGAHQPVQVHVLAYLMNSALGAIGRTVDFVAVEPSAASTIQALATAIKGGSVRTLFVLNGNPAYNAPADLDFGALLKSVPEVIRYGYYHDETSALAGTHLAATHYLESWGDARTVDGTIVPIQPMILPLFNGLMEVELLARLAGEAKPDAYEQVFATRGGDRKAFEKFLHDGYAEGTAYPVVGVSARPVGALDFAGFPAIAALSKDNLEVRFATDHKMDDGRFANNGWLQECPDPMTKLAWDNAILISPRLAKDLGIVPGGSLLQVARKEEAEFSVGRENAYVGEVALNGRKITGPLHIQPGLANYTIVLPLGYGRTKTGHVGTGAGFSAYPLRTSDALGFATGATLRVTGERKLLANTQEHWSMEGRDIVREANLDEFKDNPGFVAGIGMESHSPAIYGDLPPAEFAKLSREERAKITAARAGTTPRGQSLYETPDFAGKDAKFDGLHQWGMSIDLNTCIGCNACVVACQAENNIPIVGRDQVLRGREMHWIRLDRYYSDGSADPTAFGQEGGNSILPEDPQVSMQPMTCQHCELAPCETVCPVNATVHDEEGLNVMAYNRCIGTRYCANNCPYKVRRFNFFDFNKRATDALYLGPLGHQQDMPELVKMVKNPDVTIRMRGVMEKCTYCVQRIQQAKIARKRQTGLDAVPEIPDGTIKVACQQVCPVEAIVFGNVRDEKSAVSRAKAQERDYAVLGYLNIRPRTTYLGKLRNPNPHMPDYSSLPLSRVEYNRKNGHAGHGGGHPEAAAHGPDDHAAKKDGGHH